MNKKKHILIISQYFYPENFRINDIAVEWVKRGYKVTVLTGIPNYPQGKFYEGYDKKHRIRENWNGVDIIRLPIIARGNSNNKIWSFLRLLANYLSFVKSGRKWVRSIEAKKLNVDLVFTFEVSPMTQALIGVWYGKKYKVPTYLYVQDLWPENVETVMGIHNKLIIGPIDRMVDKIYRNTDIIFATSESFVKAIVRRKHPVDRNKVKYWAQYAEEFYKPLEPQSVIGIDNNSCFKIAFTGNIGTAQGLEILPKVANLLKKDNILFVIVGEGRYKSELIKVIKEEGVMDKFAFVQQVAPERIPIILSACDAGFISFRNETLWENTIPAKLQSYLACGKAVIASASGETKRIVEDAKCGVCAEIGNAEALAEAIRKLVKMDTKDLGINARAYFDRFFNKQKLMDEMDEYLKGNNNK